MKTIFSILQILSRFYWIKKIIISYSKKYLMKHHILPIIEEINEEQIYNGNFLTLKDAISSDAFSNGLIDHFLKPNDYMLNTKDIAIAINMGAHGHSNDTFIKESAINAAFYLTKKIKERFTLDDNLKYIIRELGKDVSKLDLNYERKDIEKIFDDKKILFKEYFNIYTGIDGYSKKITVYYPGYEKSWIDYKEDESLQISIFPHDIPRGFFLLGFDYKYEDNWLSSAIRTKEQEYFNSSRKAKGEIIWSN